MGKGFQKGNNVKGKGVFINNVYFDSIKSAAVYLNIGKDLVIHSATVGYYQPKAKVLFDGKVYDCFNHIVKELKIGINKVKSESKLIPQEIIKIRFEKSINDKVLPSEDSTKQCVICQLIKPISDFHISRCQKDGRKSKCKECNDVKFELEERVCEGCGEKYRQKKGIRKQRFCSNDCRFLHKTFKIGIKQYNDILKVQEGCCAICGGKSIVLGKEQRLSVDHDHRTNKIRGLLCPNCNSGIGLLKDSIVILNKANNYLELHQHKDNKLINKIKDLIPL